MASSPPVGSAVERPPATRRRWLPVIVLALHAAALFWIGLVLDIDDNDNRQVGLFIGTLFAQVTLLAIWTAWAPFSWFVRIGGGLLLTGFVSLALAGTALRDQPGAAIAVFIYAVIFYGQWLAAQAPLWAARIIYRQRIVRSQDAAETALSREWQFGLGQLLALTACVAAMLGLARFLFPTDAGEELLSDWRDLLLITAIFIVSNTLAPLPTIWAALAPTRVAGWLLLAGLYMAGVAVAEAMAFAAVTGATGDDSQIFLWINLPFFVVVAGTLLAFRAAGYRLRTV